MFSERGGVSVLNSLPFYPAHSAPHVQCSLEPRKPTSTNYQRSFYFKPSGNFSVLISSDVLSPTSLLGFYKAMAVCQSPQPSLLARRTVLSSFSCLVPCLSLLMHWAITLSCWFYLQNHFQFLAHLSLSLSPATSLIQGPTVSCLDSAASSTMISLLEAVPSTIRASTPWLGDISEMPNLPVTRPPITQNRLQIPAHVTVAPTFRSFTPVSTSARHLPPIPRHPPGSLQPLL